MLIENWKLPADLDSVAGKIEYVDFLVWLIMQSGGLGNRVYKTHVSFIQGLGMRLDDIRVTPQRLKGGYCNFFLILPLVSLDIIYGGKIVETGRSGLKTT